MFLRHFRLNSKKKLQRGRSMVEIMAVIAVIGVLSVGAILGFRYAIAKNQANAITKSVKLRAATISTNAGFSAAAFDVVSPAADETPTAALSDLLTVGGYKTSEDGVTYAAQKINETEFTITVSDVSKEVCQRMIDSVYPEAEKIDINGISFSSTTAIGNPRTCLDSNAFVFHYNPIIFSQYIVGEPPPDPGCTLTTKECFSIVVTNNECEYARTNCASGAATNRYLNANPGDLEGKECCCRSVTNNAGYSVRKVGQNGSLECVCPPGQNSADNCENGTLPYNAAKAFDDTKCDCNYTCPPEGLTHHRGLNGLDCICSQADGDEADSSTCPERSSTGKYPSQSLNATCSCELSCVNNTPFTHLNDTTNMCECPVSAPVETDEGYCCPSGTPTTTCPEGQYRSSDHCSCEDCQPHTCFASTVTGNQCTYARQNNCAAGAYRDPDANVGDLDNQACCCESVVNFSNESVQKIWMLDDPGCWCPDSAKSCMNDNGTARKTFDEKHCDCNYTCPPEGLTHHRGLDGLDCICSQAAGDNADSSTCPERSSTGKYPSQSLNATCSCELSCVNNTPFTHLNDTTNMCECPVSAPVETDEGYCCPSGTPTTCTSPKVLRSTSIEDHCSCLCPTNQDSIEDCPEGTGEDYKPVKTFDGETCSCGLVCPPTGLTHHKGLSGTTCVCSQAAGDNADEESDCTSLGKTYDPDTCSCIVPSRNCISRNPGQCWSEITNFQCPEGQSCYCPLSCSGKVINNNFCCQSPSYGPGCSSLDPNCSWNPSSDGCSCSFECNGTVITHRWCDGTPIFSLDPCYDLSLLIEETTCCPAGTPSFDDCEVNGYYRGSDHCSCLTTNSDCQFTPELCAAIGGVYDANNPPLCCYSNFCGPATTCPTGQIKDPITKCCISDAVDPCKDTTCPEGQTDTIVSSFGDGSAGACECVCPTGQIKCDETCCPVACNADGNGCSTCPGGDGQICGESCCPIGTYPDQSGTECTCHTYDDPVTPVTPVDPPTPTNPPTVGGQNGCSAGLVADTSTPTCDRYGVCVCAVGRTLITMVEDEGGKKVCCPNEEVNANGGCNLPSSELEAADPAAGEADCLCPNTTPIGAEGGLKEPGGTETEVGNSCACAAGKSETNGKCCPTLSNGSSDGMLSPSGEGCCSTCSSDADCPNGSCMSKVTEVCCWRSQEVGEHYDCFPVVSSFSVFPELCWNFPGTDFASCFHYGQFLYGVSPYSGGYHIMCQGCVPNEAESASACVAEMEESGNSFMPTIGNTGNIKIGTNFGGGKKVGIWGSDIPTMATQCKDDGGELVRVPEGTNGLGTGGGESFVCSTDVCCGDGRGETAEIFQKSGEKTGVSHSDGTFNYVDGVLMCMGSEGGEKDCNLPGVCAFEAEDGTTKCYPCPKFQCSDCVEWFVDGNGELTDTCATVSQPRESDTADCRTPSGCTSSCEQGVLLTVDAGGNISGGGSELACQPATVNGAEVCQCEGGRVFLKGSSPAPEGVESCRCSSDCTACQGSASKACECMGTRTVVTNFDYVTNRGQQQGAVCCTDGFVWRGPLVKCTAASEGNPTCCSNASVFPYCYENSYYNDPDNVSNKGECLWTGSNNSSGGEVSIDV